MWFLLQIVGLAIAVVFFALMRQARAWEHDLPIPSMLTAVECNMKLSPFLLVTAVPLLIPLVLSVLQFHPVPSVSSFLVVSLACYMVANGLIIIVIVISQFVFHVCAVAHVFFRKRSVILPRSLLFLKTTHSFSTTLFCSGLALEGFFSPII